MPCSSTPARFAQILARELTSDGNDDNDKAAFVTVGSRKMFRPLECFTIPEVDFASARVPFPWARGANNTPDVTVTVDMRLEADASHQVERFGRGRGSTRCREVRKKVGGVIHELQIVPQTGSNPPENDRRGND